MPFDFKNTNGTSSSDGGFNSGFSGSVNNSGTNNSAGSSGFTGVPTANPTPTGFSNVPQYKPTNYGNDNVPIHQQDRPPIINNNINTPRKPKIKGAGFDAPNLPWGIVIKVLAVVAVIATLYIFRDAITEFLAQIIVWVIIIAVLWIIVKLFFRRR